jgi:Tfp pilus assembly protein PilN
MRAVNLIPADERSGGRALQLSSLSPATVALIGGLLVALVAVVALVLVDGKINDRHREAARVQAQTQAAQAELAARASAIAGLQDLQRQVAALRTTAGARYDWPATFARISGVLPGDVKVTNLSGSLAGASSAAPAPAAPTTGGASLAITGCAGSLRSLATAMQRMRLLKGIEDVTLGSATHGDAGGSGCPQPQAFTLTVALTGPAAPSTTGATP